MMIKNDFIATIKSNGQILREDGSTVFIPFGGEYSIYMKNLRSQKAQVSVTIDGVDVLGGSKLLIEPNSTLDLERFLSDDMNKGNRFRYIQKTEQIQSFRGDRIDDGIVRITFKYEKQRIHNPILINQGPMWSTTAAPLHNTPMYGTPVYRKGYDSGMTCDSFMTSSCSSVGNSLRGKSVARSMDVTHERGIATPIADEGITVKGSESDQSFRTGYIGTLEEVEHVMTLQLKGFKEDGQVVKQAVTVKTKKPCETCGRVNKSNAKFCQECGTFLS